MGGNDGIDVGTQVGSDDGVDVGTEVGSTVGLKEGLFVGQKVGITDGTAVGRNVGEQVGKDVGTQVGSDDGVKLGRFVGFCDGTEVGKWVPISIMLRMALFSLSATKAWDPSPAITIPKGIRNVAETKGPFANPYDEPVSVVTNLSENDNFRIEE